MKNYVPVGLYALHCLDSYKQAVEGIETTSTFYVPAPVAQRLVNAGFIVAMDGWRLVAADDSYEDMLLQLPESFIVRC